MAPKLSPSEHAKFLAAKRALDFVEDGMRLGLGTGSTAAWMVKCLGELVREEGLKVVGVATSTRTAELAEHVGVTVKTLDEVKWLDLTIDGADEFDSQLNLIKGGGGALLHEKVVATASDQMVVIADPNKRVDVLGAYPLPVEVLPFGMQTTQALIEEMLMDLPVRGHSSTVRMNGQAPFVTDEGNHVLDLHLGQIDNPHQLSLILNQVPGVVENGLFLDICDVLVVGSPDGSVEVHDINNGTVSQEDPSETMRENLFDELSSPLDPQ